MALKSARSEAMVTFLQNDREVRESSTGSHVHEPDKAALTTSNYSLLDIGQCVGVCACRYPSVCQVESGLDKPVGCCCATCAKAEHRQAISSGYQYTKQLPMFCA